MADKLYTVKLDFFGTQGAWHALMNTEVKGRSASRNHDRCVKALKSKCMKMRSEMDGDFIGGTIELESDRYTYLSDIAKKKLEASIPGSLGEAYCALMDALDEADRSDKSVDGTAKA